MLRFGREERLIMILNLILQLIRSSRARDRDHRPSCEWECGVGIAKAATTRRNQVLIPLMQVNLTHAPCCSNKAGPIRPTEQVDQQDSSHGQLPAKQQRFWCT